MLLPLLLLACHAGGEDTALPAWPDPPTACPEELRAPADGGWLDGEGAPADPHQDALGDEPAPQQLLLGFPGDPSTTAGVTWVTDEGTLSSLLELSDGEHAPVRIEGASFSYEVVGSEWERVRVHEVRLCGLEPGTRYTYRVGGEGAWSDPRSFRTAPAPGEDAPVRLAVLGDSNMGYATWGELARAVAAAEPDLVVHTGDVLHGGDSELEWESWFAEGAELLGSFPLQVAHGNHDELAGLYFAHVVQPGNEEYFSFDWGPLHLTFLNDSERDDDFYDGEERDFLDADLASTTRPWRLVAHHRPPYCSHDGGNEGLRESWGPLYDEHGVNLVLNGHWHLYERSVPIRDGAEAASSAGGTTYLVSGGAGALLYDCGEAWFTATCEAVHHYLLIDFDGDGALLRAVREDGSLIEEVELRRAP